MYHLNSSGNIFSGLKEMLEPFSSAKFLIVADTNVDKLYSDKLAAAIEKETFKCVIPSGEKSKSVDTAVKIWSALAKYEFTRDDIIIALGGGVVGDIVGFAAATYLRGIRYINVPTTLLAMVDSSVGGKTGVDIPEGKNLVGAFHKPLFTFTDIRTLDTLPESEIKNGIGEIIKYYALTGSKLIHSYFPQIFTERFSLLLQACISFKNELISEDFNDNGVRQFLNFGHTLGHVIEKHSDYQIPHGEAVAIGMCKITKWAEEKGLTEKGTFETISDLCKDTGLATDYELSADELLKSAVHDKKRRGNILNLVLLRKIGEPFLYESKIS